MGGFDHLSAECGTHETTTTKDCNTDCNTTGYGTGVFGGFFMMFIVVFLLLALVSWLARPAALCHVDEDGKCSDKLNPSNWLITVLVLSLVITLLLSGISNCCVGGKY